MSEARVLDLTSICRCFPDSPSPEVCRDNLLDTIGKIFENIDVVVVEGEEGIGKTTLLAQFAGKYPGVGDALNLLT
jgi:ABC-type taurine transport system ATPase subunit